MRYSFVRTVSQLVDVAELNRFGGARFRAGRSHVFAKPVVTQRALPRPAVFFATVDHAKRAVHNAIAGTVAHVGLHIYGIEFCADDGARRTTLQASGARAVLPNIRKKQPGESPCVLRGNRDGT